METLCITWFYVAHLKHRRKHITLNNLNVLSNKSQVNNTQLKEPINKFRTILLVMNYETL